MSGRFMAFLAVCVAALALVVPSALSAPAAGTSVQIGKNAALVAPTQIAVPVFFQCPQGATGGVVMSVSQQQPSGPNTTGSGFIGVACTGARQMLTVLVNGGPFNLGPAFASAEGFSGANFVFDSRVITIG